MALPQGLHELIEKFKQNHDQYSSPEYKEAELRKEFIDPLFEILGWDMTNEKGAAEQYKDVKYEPSLEVEGGTKAPDYAFRIGGTVKFFMEAKKPSVNISQDSSPAFQLRRYAWSQDIPLSILTNFESIYVYDGRFKPHKTDNPSNARTMRIDIDELENRWDEFSNIFSCDAVLKGSFDRYAVDTKSKKGTSKVNDEFLKEIEGWREAIAKNIAVRNPKPGIEELNYSVQKIIDRIIFLRICEDRGTEPPEQLRELIKKAHIYRRLVDLFQLADAKYNSGLFHFQADKKRGTHPDEITPKLKIDDEVLEKIIGGLYYPDSPYQFDVIPADILGQVYEQFLGKVIRLTEGHHAKVEEKPEVKKAGGVYYTPAYIVKYIVENTVGVLCKGKTPDEMQKLRILDPACGSGSFLIVAYERMLKEHLDWYISNEPKKRKDNVFQGQKGEWRLTLKEKKRILLNNIYGVDIDGQAVEVTKLNLLLKALEGESKESVDNVNKWFREPALPDLENNIRCGNSLVDFDIEEMLKDLSPEEREQELHRIKPFSWNNEFPTIMKNGGFDVVIGNPPYIRIQTMKEWAPVEVEHYKKTYKSASSGNYDIYMVFVEKGLSVLNLKGRLGYILPHKFFQAQFGQPGRHLISEKRGLIEIVHFGAEQVFQNATTYTCMMFLSPEPRDGFKFLTIKSLKRPNELFKAIHDSLPHPDYSVTLTPQPPISDCEWNFLAGSESKVLTKMGQQPTKLMDITRKIFVGLQTSADKIYVLKIIRYGKQTVQCYSESLQRDVEIEVELTKPFLMGKDIHRYEPVIAKSVVIFPYIVENGKAVLMSQEYIREKYPKGWQYLIDNKEELAGREKGKFKQTWWQYGRTQNLTEFEVVKIMTPEIAFGCQMTYDESGTFYHTTKIYSFIFKDCQMERAFYFLGILNSKLLWFFLKSTGYALRGGFFTFKTEYLKLFPIYTINFSDPADKARHDKMVSLVERMLKLHKDLEEIKTPDAKTQLQRTIEATDKEIDTLVYELYGLTEEEIKIVAGIE